MKTDNPPLVLEPRWGNPFIVAIQAGDLVKVRSLLKSGVDVQQENNIGICCAVILTKSTPMVRLLLDSGADVHARDEYCLIKAVNRGWYEMAKLLLEYGANIHAKEDQAFSSAIHNGDLKMAKLLLNHGANIGCQKHRPLRDAVRSWDPEAVKFLIAHGESPLLGKRWANKASSMEIFDWLSAAAKSRREGRQLRREKTPKPSQRTLRRL